MSEEISQENTNVPADNNDAEEIISNNPSSENQEKSQNMEIHYPHNNHHERKLKDYFFEFFMLFIAITAGFFMENLRETYVENHRESQYASSLIRDIQQDTSEIVHIIELNKTQVKGIDSLLKLLQRPVSEIDLRKLYLLTNNYLGNLAGFSAREVTINQLRSTGSLRLIDDRSVSDSIVLYYSTFNSHLDQQRYVIQTMKDILELSMKAMDYSAFTVEDRSMTFEMSYIKEFYNRALVFRSLLNSEINWMEDYYKQGVSLLSYLKKEYK